MPFYDFRCTACGAAFEKLVRADDRPPCPTCGAAATERLVSAPAAPGRSAELMASGRRAAAREGHFSHYSAADRRRAGKP